MKPADNLEQSIRRLRFTGNPAMDERILGDMAAALKQSRGTSLKLKQSTIWRIVMKSNWSKLAAAAAIVIVVGLSITAFNGTTTPAYALEQTLEANRCLKCFHIRVDPPGRGLGEAWAQLNEDGELLRLRMDFPNTKAGPKVVIWEDDKAEVWFKGKGAVQVLREKNILAQFPHMLLKFDPKVAMERLHAAEAQGIATIETQEPSAEGEPITLVVSRSNVPEAQEVYLVNPDTKLVEEIQKYRLNGEKFELVSRQEYLDYSQPIDPNIFILDLPDDAVRADQTTPFVGLAKGNLTDDEIAVKVAREFFEAIIAKDYTKAGQICHGIPAMKMEELLGGLEVVQIISIGQPTPHPDPKTKFLCVPCEIEVIKDGVKSSKKFVLNIRHIYGRPDRWAVGGERDDSEDQLFQDN